MNLLTAPRPFFQRHCLHWRLGLPIGTGYRHGYPANYRSQRRRHLAQHPYRRHALSYHHKRRCLARRARAWGMIPLGHGLWYDQATDASYIQTVRGLEETEFVMYNGRNA